MGYYSWENYAHCISKIGGLTAWRNADVKLATGECVESPPWIDAIITQPHELTTRQGRPGSYIAGRYGSSMVDGYVRANYRLTDAQLIYWLMQKCTTTDDDPAAGFQTHTMATPDSTTPLDLGMHFQTSLTDNNLYWDLLGLCPQRLTIKCSEYDRTAIQTLESQYAYLQASSDSFTKTDRAEGTEGTVTKTWDHFYDNFTFTYNSGSTECDIIGFTVVLTRNTWMGTRDANGYATAGLMLGFDYAIQLEVIPTGDQLFTLARTKKSSYAGDLDLVIQGTETANDKITLTFDKLFMTSFDRAMSYAQRPESYVINLEPLDQTSSLVPVGIDSLADDYYES